MHQSNVDLLGVDRSSGDAYLQTMNENLHKKFRRPNPHHPLIHSGGSEDFPHLIANSHLISDLHQINGDYKNNLNKPTIGNGQGLAAAAPPPSSIGSTRKTDQHEDDDDIVLVSDDDSAEKPVKPAMTSELLPPSSLNIETSLVFHQQVIIQSSATYSKDQVTSLCL